MVLYNAVFSKAIGHMGGGTTTINWSSTAAAYRLWPVLLLNNAPYTNTNTLELYSGIAYGTGYEIQNTSPNVNYALGGAATAYTANIPMAPGTVTTTSNTTYFDAPDPSWGTATFSCYYAIIQQGTTAATAGNYLVSYHDLTLGTGTVQSVVSGTFTIQWYNGGTAPAIFTITASATSS